MNASHQPDPSSSRLRLVRGFTCAGFLAGLLYTPNLWRSAREFPTIPVIPGLPDLPDVLAVALYAALIVSLIGVAIAPNPRRWIYAPVLVAAALVLFDINRLQPWMYLYCLLLVACGSPAPRTAWSICAFLLIATYFWSGLQKVNGVFLNEVYPFLVRPFPILDQRAFAFSAPILEAGLGLMLAVPRLRLIGLMGAALMHGLLLIALAWVHDYNSAVWPWNLTMALLAFALFWRCDLVPSSHLLGAWRGRAVVLLVGILPGLNFLGWWDGYLSASLYSGRERYAVVSVPAESIRSLPPTAVAQVEARGGSELALVDWGLRELNAPPYPELRVYRAIFDKLALPPRAVLLVREPPGFAGGPEPFEPVR